MAVLLASVSVWFLLVVGVAVVALVLLLSVEFGHQARRIRSLRAARESERADFAAWHARHAGCLCEETTCRTEEPAS
ncbi:MAG: hypothetical protein KGN34_15190 [Sphingomonadales bacterium]|nr:hypothetical protein [Sphingomonadales bacterium]